MRTLLIVLTLLVATATPAAAATPLEAGTPLSSPSGLPCLNGFNVRGHLLVPPSCGGVGTIIRGPGGAEIGPVIAVRQTYAVVQITNTAAWVQHPTVVGYWNRITGSFDTPVGGSVCAASRTTTGLRCGTVQAKNVTVAFPSGTISGLTRTSLCAETGDHWLAFFSGSQAQGHMVGANGNCSTGGTSFFYPINRILAAEGFSLVTG